RRPGRLPARAARAQPRRRLPRPHHHRRSPPMSVLSDSRVLAGRSLRHAVREPEVLMLGVALPVSIMLLMTVVFGGALDTGGGAYVDYVVPGVLLLVGGYG